MTSSTLPGELDISKTTQEDAYVAFSLMNRRFVVGSIDEVVSSLHNNYQLIEDERFTSNRFKFLISFRYEFYHTIMDTLSTILRVQRVRPETLFIIYADTRYTNSYSLYEPILRALDKAGIDYLVIDDPKGSINGLDPLLSVSRMTNFSYLVEYDLGMNGSLIDIKAAFDLIKSMSLVDSSYVPDKWVYISRGGAGFTLWEDDNHPGYRDDIRVHNEERLEEFLKSVGFSITKPEDMNSFQDQVDLMAQTSVLVAPTGSGLVNAGLLKDNQIVVELRCELLSKDPTDQRLIGTYQDLSYICGHSHISVSNKEKEAEVAIARLRTLLGPAPTHITSQY